MSSSLPPEAAFEIKLIFLRELEANHAAARASFDRLRESPGEAAALKAVRDFFHKISGTAYAADLDLLGHLSGACEQMCDAVREGRAGLEPLMGALDEGFAGVASVLEAHGSLPPRPEWPQPEERPGAASQARLLSRILVVDADPFGARLVDESLRAAGFVSSSCDPQKALETIVAELPDLVVLDAATPGLDGFGLCRKMRAHPALQLTPVLFLTRKGDDEQRVAGLEAGGNDWLSKPFEPQELVARVGWHLRRVASLRELALRDGLTRCFNRRYLKQRLDQEIARCRRYGACLALGLVTVERAAGEAQGWAVEDAALARLGSVLMAAVRSTDVVARLDGDRFALLFMEAGPKELDVLTARLLERIGALAAIAPGEGRSEATVRLGLTALTAEDGLESLLQRAEAALQSAQQGGRGVVRAAL